MQTVSRAISDGTPPWFLPDPNNTLPSFGRIMRPTERVFDPGDGDRKRRRVLSLRKDYRRLSTIVMLKLSPEQYFKGAQMALSCAAIRRACLRGAVPVSVKACAVTVLKRLMRGYPEVLTEARLLIEEQVSDASPAFRARSGIEFGVFG